MAGERGAQVQVQEECAGVAAEWRGGTLNFRYKRDFFLQHSIVPVRWLSGKEGHF